MHEKYTRSTLTSNACDGYLVVTILDPVEVLYVQGIRGDKAVQGENFVRLNCGDKSATALANDMRDWQGNIHLNE